MIVNPWLFYLMHVTKMLSNVFVTMAVAGVCVTGMSFMFLAFECGAETYSSKQYRRTIKVMLPVAIIGAVGMVIVPNNDTILMMQAAKLATTDNVNFIFESLKNAIDYAVGILK